MITFKLRSHKKVQKIIFTINSLILDRIWYANIDDNSNNLLDKNNERKKSMIIIIMQISNFAFVEDAKIDADYEKGALFDVNYH